MKRIKDILSLVPGVLLLLVVAMAGSSCGDGDEVEPKEGVKPLVVYTTFYPTTYFTRIIGGGHVEVVCPIPDDADPIHYDPPAEMIRKYQEADLIVLNGAGFAKWVPRAMLPEEKVVDAGASFAHDLIEIGDAVVHSHGTEGEHSHGGIDPHTWLDPILAMEQCRAICAALKERDPAHAVDFDAGLEKVLAGLETLDARIRALKEGTGALLFWRLRPSVDWETAHPEAVDETIEIIRQHLDPELVCTWLRSFHESGVDGATEKTAKTIDPAVIGNVMRFFPAGSDLAAIQILDTTLIPCEAIIPMIENLFWLDFFIVAESEKDEANPDTISIDLDKKLYQLAEFLKNKERDEGGWSLDTDLSSLSESLKINGKDLCYQWFPHSEHTLYRHELDVPGTGSTFDSLRGDSWEDNSKVAARYFVLLKIYKDRKWRFTSGDMASLDLAKDNLERPIVEFELKENRKAEFKEFTGAHEKKFLAIVINGSVFSTPVIKTALPGAGYIEGGGLQGFTVDEQRSLFTLLNSASSPLMPVRQELSRTPADKPPLIVASHPAYNYLCRRYGFPVKSFDFDPESAPDEEALAVFKEFLDKRQGAAVKWMLWESAPSPEVEEIFRTRFQLEPLVFSPAESRPGGDLDYLDLMNHNVDGLVRLFVNP